MTPYEALYGKKPTLKYFRIFGCVAHAKRPANKLTKLSDHSVAMVYLDNKPGSKAFHLYNPSEKQKYVARDVIFDERAKWKWAGVQNKAHVFRKEWIRFQSEVSHDAWNDDQVQDGGAQYEEGSPIPHSDPSTPPMSP